MGECPDGYTLDRINVNGNYEPDNCRWASPLLQGRSKRPGKYISPNGSGFRVSLHLLPRTLHKRHFRLLEDAQNYLADCLYEREFHRALSSIP